MPAIQDLSRLIAQGLPSAGSFDAASKQIGDAIEGLFGERYPKNSARSSRVVYLDPQNNVPFAGLLHPESPSSGVYGGMSLIWFPVCGGDDGSGRSLITFVCGTRGLSPDEQILGRPGHARNVAALKRYVEGALKIPVWAKHDPTNLLQGAPAFVKEQFAAYRPVFEKYGQHIYLCAEVPSEPVRAEAVVSAFLDLYAWEREWSPLQSCRKQVDDLRDQLRASVFPKVSREDVVSLLKERRFVVLQGPPGTGKSRLATQILEEEFAGRGLTIQFHPAVTYETFVSGIAPAVGTGSLSFSVRGGALVDAIHQAGHDDFLLYIDELNRADLGSVLGEAIYLLEPREITAGQARTVRLPQPLADGTEEISIPKNLFILGTMNSADRSTAILDLAVRRRFAFLDMWPDLAVVVAQGFPLATQAFGTLLDVFRQHASEDGLALVPGHSYFLAGSPEELERRLRFDLMPLLRDYIRDGRVGSFESEVRSYLGWLEGEIDHVG